MRIETIVFAVWLAVGGSAFSGDAGDAGPAKPDRESRNASSKQRKAATPKTESNKSNKPAEPQNLFVIVEFVEVEMADFSEWVGSNSLESDATPLRTAVRKWEKDGSAKVAETLVVTARSGQRAKAEAVEEHIYATEFDPPEAVTNQLAGDKPVTGLVPPNPTAFETRNVGATLEVDPVLDDDGTVHLNLAPEIVIAAEPIKIGSKLGKTEMHSELPRFLSSKITTQIQVRPGDYGFLGTSRLGEAQLEDADDPILLFFVRCDVSGGGE